MTPKEHQHLKKLQRQTGWYEGPNLIPMMCEAAVEVRGTGSTVAGGSFVQCSKYKRAGHQTCWHHRKLEEDNM